MPFFNGGFGGQNQPRCAIGNLRAITRRNATVFTIKKRLEFGQTGHARIGAHAIILGVNITFGVDQRNDLAKMPGFALHLAPGH